MSFSYKIQFAGDLPAKNTSTDACYDIIAATDPIVFGVKLFDLDQSVGTIRDSWNSVTYIQYDTNLKLQPSESNKKLSAVFVYPRSSISKYNLVLANSVGVIDAGYTGNLLVRFKYIFQPKDLKYVYGSIVGSIDETAIYKQGDKIGQLKFEILDQVTLSKVTDLSQTERGAGGFGSSGA